MQGGWHGSQMVPTGWQLFSAPRLSVPRAGRRTAPLTARKAPPTHAERLPSWSAAGSTHPPGEHAAWPQARSPHHAPLPASPNVYVLHTHHTQHTQARACTHMPLTRTAHVTHTHHTSTTVVKSSCSFCRGAELQPTVSCEPRA